MASSVFSAIDLNKGKKIYVGPRMYFCFKLKYASS